MKKILYCFFVTLLCVFCFASCGEKETETSSSSSSAVKESSIAFAQSEIVLSVGESVQAEIEISKKNVFIFWSVSDEALATVSDDGVITALAVGQTICYAEFAGETAMCLVKIIAQQAKPLLSVSVPYEDEINLYVGDSIALKATVQLGDSVLEDAQLEYEISQTDIVRVEKDKVIGEKVGGATILVRAVYENQEATVTLTVNVVEK